MTNTQWIDRAAERIDEQLFNDRPTVAKEKLKQIILSELTKANTATKEELDNLTKGLQELTKDTTTVEGLEGIIKNCVKSILLLPYVESAKWRPERKRQDVQEAILANITPLFQQLRQAIDAEKTSHHATLNGNRFLADSVDALKQDRDRLADLNDFHKAEWDHAKDERDQLRAENERLKELHNHDHEGVNQIAAALFGRADMGWTDCLREITRLKQELESK